MAVFILLNIEKDRNQCKKYFKSIFIYPINTIIYVKEYLTYYIVYNFTISISYPNTLDVTQLINSQFSNRYNTEEQPSDKKLISFQTRCSDEKTRHSSSVNSTFVVQVI